jgi:hypothetical protein
MGTLSVYATDSSEKRVLLTQVSGDVGNQWRMMQVDLDDDDLDISGVFKVTLYYAVGMCWVLLCRIDTGWYWIVLYRIITGYWWWYLDNTSLTFCQNKYEIFHYLCGQVFSGKTIKNR